MNEKTVIENFAISKNGFKNIILKIGGFTGKRELCNFEKLI